MNRLASAVVLALITGMGTASAARSATINFAASVLDGADLGFTGTTLDKSTAFNFDGASLLVSSVGAGDQSGLSAFPGPGPDSVTLAPLNLVYGSGTGPSTLQTDLIKSWTGANGDMFTETLTNVKSIDRNTANVVTVFLTGTVSDTLGLFTADPVNFILSANEVGGAGTAISAGFTNTTVLAVVPETSTWVMMTLGFAGLGYAASRRNNTKGRALAT